MSVWVAFGIITVVLMGGIIALAINERRFLTRERRAHALRTCLPIAFGPALIDAARGAELAGWTEQDMTLFAGLIDPRWGLHHSYSLAGRLNAAATAPDWPGHTVRERIVWAYALVPPGAEPRLLDLRLPWDVRNTTNQREREVLKAARRWHDTLGVVGAYALAAGLSFTEARDAHRAGTLDVDSLATLAALRGNRMPSPDTVAAAA